MRIFKIIIFFMIIIAIVFGIVYITYKHSNSHNLGEAVARDGTINILLITPDCFNPIVSNNKYVQDMSKLVFEGLTSVSPQLKVEPCLAAVIEPNAEYLTYKVLLQQNVKFHNSEKFTAKDVEFTINKIKELGELSVYAYNVKNIKSVEIIDEYELKIKLKEIDNFLPEKLNFPILSKEYYENKDLSQEKYCIGTGKYKVSSVDQDKIVLVYNDKYRNESKGNIGNIVAKIINKSTPGFEALKSGTVDIADTNIAVGAYGRSAFASKRYDTGNFEAILFNLENDKTKDKNVRQAILLGINRDKIIDEFLSGYGNKAEIPINPSSYLCDNSLYDYAYNPGKASDILTNTGWGLSNSGIRSKGDVNLNLEILIDSERKDSQQKAEIIKENLKEIGIAVEIVSKSKSDYETLIRNKQYQMALTNWGVSYYTEFLYSFETNKNLSGFSNEEYNSLVYSSKREILENKLKDNFYRMQNILNDSLPIAGLYFETSTVYYNKGIKGDLESNMEDIYSNIENAVVDM